MLPLGVYIYIHIYMCVYIYYIYTSTLNCNLPSVNVWSQFIHRHVINNVVLNHLFSNSQLQYTFLRFYNANNFLMCDVIVLQFAISPTFRMEN